MSASERPAGSQKADVAALARAGALFRRMTSAEFRKLMDVGVLGDGHHDHVELMVGEIAIKNMGKGGYAHEIYKAALRIGLS